MSIPNLTPLQFFILSCLIFWPRSGHALRAMLRKEEGRTRKRSAPSFYMLMARMERDKLIRGRSEGTKRIYRITAKGTAAFGSFRHFVQKHGGE